jgi:hypothetical protein
VTRSGAIIQSRGSPGNHPGTAVSPISTQLMGTLTSNGSKKETAISRQLSAISFQLSAFSYQKALMAYSLQPRAKT